MSIFAGQRKDRRVTLPAEAPLYTVEAGDGPLLINVPHAGTELPDGLAKRLAPDARALSDTDWHMDELARAAAPAGATVMAARLSRYVVDLNRPSDDAPLYTGATTGVMSTIDFDGNPLYTPGREPDADEQARRVETYWRPYHERLAAEVATIRARRGICVMLDVHSIRSRVPRLFDGVLPDLNLGTHEGASADPALVAAVWQVLQDSGRTAVRDGRFKGGHITRHYGRPADGVHVLQIEIAQHIYMRERPPWTLDPDGAARLRNILGQIMAAMSAFAKGAA